MAEEESTKNDSAPDETTHQEHPDGQAAEAQSTETANTGDSHPDQPAVQTKTDAQNPVPQTDADQPSGTITLVWQWLTYGLWSWTLASLGVLLSSTLAYFIATDTHDGDFTWLIYITATALCLLPISYVVDQTYSKHEPSHKHGFAAVILVLHAVLAFLVSIGALITAVVTLLSLATDTSGDTAVKTTVIISALLIAALGGLFFARIVRPPKLEVISRKFGLIVSIIATVTIIAALAGPYAATIKTKTDRQIEAGLYGVNSAIQDYARNNKKLPASLDVLTFDSYQKESQALVKKGLVTYSQKGEDTSSSNAYTRIYRYELCANYKKSKGNGTVHASLSTSTYNDSYLDTNSHPAGHTCYQQSAYVTDTSSPVDTKPLTTN